MHLRSLQCNCIARTSTSPVVYVALYKYAYPDIYIRTYYVGLPVPLYVHAEVYTATYIIVIVCTSYMRVRT